VLPLRGDNHFAASATPAEIIDAAHAIDELTVDE
jgi:hypothetical protein